MVLNANDKDVSLLRSINSSTIGLIISFTLAYLISKASYIPKSLRVLRLDVKPLDMFEMEYLYKKDGLDSFFIAFIKHS